MGTYPDPGRAVALHRGGRASASQAIPGVERAAVSTDVPLLGVRQGDAVTVAGHATGGIGVRFKRVDPGLFRHARHPACSSGRGFTARDRAGAPRVVDRQRGAGAPARGAASASPIRRRRRPDRAASPAPVYENRGQARKGRGRRDRRHDSQRARATTCETPVQEVVYVPLLQAPRREIKLIVRTRSDPAAAMPGHPRRGRVRSIRACRSATCGRWSR